MKSALLLVCLACFFLTTGGTETSESNDSFFRSCKIAARDPEKLECHGLDQTSLPFVAAYANVTAIEVTGEFEEMRIDSRYRRLTALTLRSYEMRQLRFSLFTHLASSLEQLEVISSGVEAIDTEGGESLEKLARITLSRNSLLKNITASFARFPRLSELHLDRLRLSEFDFALLPSTLHVLNLNENHISSYSCRALRGLSGLQTLKLTFTRLKEFSFSCLPPNLITLDMGGNDLMQHNFDGLASLERLVSLSLSYNDLKEFDFTHLPLSVEDLALFSNKISVVRCDARRDGMQLRQVMLFQNDLTEFDYSCLPDTVSSLDLSFNRISSEIPCNQLRRLRLLSTLNLRNNELGSFDFKCLNENIKQLALENNFIVSMELMDLDKIKSASVSLFNNEVICDCKFLFDFGALLAEDHVHFDCAGGETQDQCIKCNPFSQLIIKPFTSDQNDFLLDQYPECQTSKEQEPKAPPVIKKSKFEQHCAFENKTLMRCSDFYTDFFAYRDQYKDMQMLEVHGFFSKFVIDKNYKLISHLKVESSTMREFDFSWLESLDSLRNVDLSNNSIDDLVVEDGNSLGVATILIDNNEITQLKMKTFASLRTLSASHNRIISIDAASLPLNLVRLDLSHNKLSSIGGGAFDGMRTLRSVDLSSNKLKNFALTRVPSSLQVLILNNNDIVRIQTENLDQFADRLRLNIGENPIRCDCDFFTSYTRTLPDSGVKLICSDANCNTCDQNSLLAPYHWDRNIEKVVEQEKMNGHCSNVPVFKPLKAVLFFIICLDRKSVV